MGVCILCCSNLCTDSCLPAPAAVLTHTKCPLIAWGVALLMGDWNPGRWGRAKRLRSQRGASILFLLLPPWCWEPEVRALHSPLDICNSLSPFSRSYTHACVLLEPFLASLHFHINSGGSLEPIKIYKPQVVSGIPKINLLSGVLICVMS